MLSQLSKAHSVILNIQSMSIISFTTTYSNSNRVQTNSKSHSTPPERNKLVLIASLSPKPWPNQATGCSLKRI